LIELVNKKKLTVEVSEDRVDFVRSMLEDKPQWDVVVVEDLEVGVRFKTEQIEWEDHLKPVYEACMELINTLSKEGE
jgi:hypothetical protein